MVFEWLHMPRESSYSRRRHLSRTPPEFWSRHDKTCAGWERSKYIRARNKEYERHGGTRMSESAQRRFHTRWPGGDGFYFPYAEALQSPFKERFRDMVDARRHGYKFKQDFAAGEYGNPSLLWALAEEGGLLGLGHDNADLDLDLDLDLGLDLDRFMSAVEEVTGRGVEGPLGWGFRGDRPNMSARNVFTGQHVPWLYNRDGRRNGPFHSPGWEHWLGDVQPEDFVRQRRR